jgi:hypothetical protein
MLQTAVTTLSLKATRNCRGALNPHMAIVLPNLTELAQIAVSTMLAPNLLQAELCLTSTVDTALWIYHSPRPPGAESSEIAEQTLRVHIVSAVWPAGPRKRSQLLFPNITNIDVVVAIASRRT